jgi:N-acetyl-alpha-D-glucosaminyl L-malate synthase BshA
MNILVINYEYPPIGGGGGVICKDISEELAAMNNKVTVITSQYQGLEAEECINGVKVIRVPVIFRNKQNVASFPSMLSYVPSCISKANNLVSHNKFDIINTHFAIPSGPVGYYISKHNKIPNILSIHGGDIFDPSKSLSPHKTIGLKQTVRKMLNSADCVIAQSSDTRRNAINYYNTGNEIKIIALGIKPNKFKKLSRSALSLPEDKYIFITVGRLIRRKNLPELLEIFSNVNSIFPSELLIVGDGPEKDNLIKTARELNISDSVKFLGRVSEEQKFQYLSASDLYLSTAMHEGFGIVFLEAMECGLPVICYDHGGQVDFLQNCTTGYLINLGNKTYFTEKLKYILKNKSLITEISNFNTNYVKEFYIQNIAKQYLSVFEESIRNYGKTNEKRH